MLNIYLIRHAESQGNVNNHLIGGRSDHFALTEQGIHQARLLAERLRREGLQFVEWHSSVALRASQTAAILAKSLGYSPEKIQTHEALAELSQGEWEGRLRTEVFTPEQREEIRKDSYNFRSPGGESLRDVEERIYNWVTENMDLSIGSPRYVMVISHGLAIRCLIRKILDSSPTMAYRSILHNTGIVCLQYRERGWHLERFNDYAHLAGTTFIDHY